MTTPVNPNLTITQPGQVNVPQFQQPYKRPTSLNQGGGARARLEAEQSQAQQQYEQQYSDYAKRIENANAAADNYNKQLELYSKQKTPGKVLGFLPDWIETPLEKLGSGLYWTYSKFISQPLSFSMLYTREAFHYVGSGLQDDPMSSRELWNQARHFSPGQSFIMMFTPDSYLKDHGIDPNDVNAGLHREDMFGSGWSKYFSGGIDFAVSWYMDPAVIGLRGAGKARQAGIVKPTAKIKDLDTNTTIVRMGETVEKIKLKYGDASARELRKNFVSVARSANGDALADALAATKSLDETADVLRVAAGDRKTLASLEDLNQRAASAVTASQARLSLVGSVYSANPTPALRSAYKAALDDHGRALTNLEVQTGIAANAKGVQDALDALNYNRFITPVGQQFRSWVDRLPRYGGDTAANNLTTSNIFARTLRYSFYSAPVKVFQLPFRAGRAWFDIAPQRYIAFDQPDSWRRVDAVLRDVRSLSKEAKDSLVSQYIRATPEMRGNVLMDIEAKTVRAIATRYGVTDDVARELFSGYNRAYEAKITNSYSNGRVQDPANPGQTIRADEWNDANGHLEKVPIDPTQMQSMRILTDFGLMDSVVRHSGSALGRLINGSSKIAGATAEKLDVMNRYWKVSNLISVRYGVRAISDDLLGQVARYGALSMAGRITEGTGGLANKWSRGAWRKSRQQSDEMQMAMGQRELGDLHAARAQYEQRVQMWPTAANRDTLARINDNIADVEAGIAQLTGTMKFKAAERPIVYDLNGTPQVIPAAYDGSSGAMFQREVANVNSHEQLVGLTAGRTKRMVSSSQWVDISRSDGLSQFKSSWGRVLAKQYANSAGFKAVLGGKNEAEFIRWMRTDPEGQQYWRVMESAYGGRNMSHADHAERVFSDVDALLPLGMPGRDQLVQAVLKGDQAAIKTAIGNIPEQYMPATVRGELEHGPAGTNSLGQSIDNAIDGFYRLANQLPAEKLSRSPLFAALYREHIDDLMKRAKDDGLTHLSPAERERMALVGRQRALRDVKALSFNMDHEQRLAHALRFVVPFGSSFMESTNRWLRIIRDKPQVLAHAANLYNSPTRAGWVVDKDGNKVDGYGYSTDPVTGQKRSVDLSERNMIMQIPDWAQPLLEKITGTPLPDIPVPMTSLIPTVQNYPIWNPGFGPFVQVPLTKLFDWSPSQKEMLQELGLAPFQGKGVMQGPGWLADAYRATTGQGLPVFGGKAGEGYDNDVLALIRKMQHDYESGERDTPPSIAEAESMARKMAGLKALQKFFLPFGGTPERGLEVKDGGQVNYKPISFFVKRYQEMIRSDPKNGTDKFLDKYGNSFFAFTQSLTKSNSTVPATTGGEKVMAEYRELLKSVDPDLGGLIAGPEGKGPFSSATYAYQLETPTMTGEMMREKLTPEELISEMNRKKGWYEYNKAMVSLQADLFDAGFQSYDDKGAERFAETRRQIVNLMTTARDASGMPNPHYNEDWERDYNTQDRGFYDRRANQMEEVVKYFEVRDAIESRDGLGRLTVDRSDIFGLRQYLANRRQVVNALAARDAAGGSADINAKQNMDIKSAFVGATLDLMEKYIPFSELHNRYLTRDMGIDIFAQRGQ